MKRCIRSFTAFCLLVEMLVISLPVFSQTSKQTKPSLLVETSEGLTMARIVTPQGIVRINFPDDMAAGDTISGTVSTEPAGSNDAEKAQNQSVLSGYVIDLGDGNKVQADKPVFTWELAAEKPAAKKAAYILKVVKARAPNGDSAGEVDIQVLATAPPAPSDINIPELGQTNHNIQITGPFGNAGLPAGTIIGGQTAPLMAASPRKIVVNVPNGITPGPNPIDVKSGSTQATGTIRVVSVGLSAPKLNLQKGEKTTLTAQVNGLQGITGPVPFQMVTTGTVNMQGGNTQDFQIQPDQVQPNGSYSQDFELTGIQLGGFNVTATLKDKGDPPPDKEKGCVCICTFAKTNMVLTGTRDAARGGTEYSFEPKVDIACTAGKSCKVKSVSYQWGVNTPSTAKYMLHPETVKTKKLVVDVTGSGTLYLWVAVVGTCNDDGTGKARGYGTFNVTAPTSIKYVPKRPNPNR